MAAQPEALKILVLHGPNLNLLGSREREIYGAETLADIDARLAEAAAELGAGVESRQSNHEGDLVTLVHTRGADVHGMVVNAAGYSHTSIALRDALVAVSRPFVEVHLSNVHARERFRRRSLLADRAVGVVCGFGGDSYVLGLRGLVARLRAYPGA
jgi:3-dehydroquinate dehydratase II